MDFEQRVRVPGDHCPLYWERWEIRSVIVFFRHHGPDLLIEESLIDFRELIGQHTGENMAAAVWETVEKFGLEGRVSAKLF